MGLVSSHKPDFPVSFFLQFLFVVSERDTRVAQAVSLRVTLNPPETFML